MLENLIAALPAYADDVKRTLAACLADGALSDEQKWSIAHASARALASAPLIKALAAETPLSAETQAAINGVAAVMAMNNVYFRAVHIMTTSEYARLRPGVRMSALVAPGIAATDIDLWSIAVSAINGCGACLDDHEAKFRKAGGAPAPVQATIKLAAALAGVAAVLRADQATA